MYSKVVIFLCAAGIASAGNLLHAAPLTYSAPVSSVSYSSHTTGHAAPIATYAAAPVVTKTISPAVSYQTISTHSAPAIAYSSLAHGSPIAYAARPVTTYAASPAVYSSVAHAAPVAYASGPIISKTLASPAVSYSSPLTYASSPVLTKTYAAPALTTYAAAAPAISTYAAAPVLKSAVTYSSAPAVSHVTYTGLGASYGW
ncbi:cuticle protein 16.5-like [Vanessa cardui]|uniref:cuticle protein 16.5-like n=1 Tax=Vanessa cardui TaxID=171605 RepID=UPI001F129667|nr:cuticle protein 16.5-like [Vanessa cardui]